MTDDATAGGETVSLGAADILKILSALPHRYPFLLIDKVVGIRGDEFGIGIKNVTFNEPHFQGHFPGAPVMPGVLMIEGMAQTAGVICMERRTSDAPQLVYFMTIDNAKFRKPVGPGDVVEYHMTRTRQRGNMWWFHGEAKVDGKVVCEADVSAMIVDRKD